MSPAARAEYDAALRAAVLQHGTLVDVRPDVYGWVAPDYDHKSTCEVTSSQAPREVEWSQFADTFAPNLDKHGVSVFGVSCACGALVNREVRWEASASEMTEALFEHVFDRIARLGAEKRNDES